MKFTEIGEPRFWAENPVIQASMLAITSGMGGFTCDKPHTSRQGGSRFSLGLSKQSGHRTSKGVVAALTHPPLLHPCR